MPLLDLMWTMLIWFLLFAWLFVVGSVVVDIFRSDDLGGFAKAVWVAVAVFFPWGGVFIYLLVRGKSMAQRYAAANATRSGDLKTYQRKTANYSDADALAELNRRRESGLIGGIDYDTQRARIMS